MDILSVISEQTTAIALALTIMWFYNKLVQDILLERKEWRDSIVAERKEWQSKSDTYINQLFEMNRQTIEAMTTNRMEMHALKNKITELLLSVPKGRAASSE